MDLHVMMNLVIPRCPNHNPTRLHGLKTMNGLRFHSSGFTLIEMAMVLLIVGLLLGGGLTVLSTQIESQKVKDTQQMLEDAKEALIGFAIANGRLPCADKTGGGGAGTANDGLEDFTVATGICVTTEGNIPWATLGVSNSDAWGNRIHYAATAAFSNHATAATFSLTSIGNLRVCQAAACATPIAIGLPAVILSYGHNGFGAINSAGNANPAPTGTDELENTNLNADFASHPSTNAGAPAGEFDDLVTWLSPNILFNRMVQAGKLP